jgi:hypothetical protein
MATARLRKGFKYPEESDSDGHPEDLDEQGSRLTQYVHVYLAWLTYVEQEELISRLHAQDTTATELYQRIFIAAPFLACFAYPFVAPVGFGLVTATLCVSSLLYSAYYLFTLPVTSSRQVEYDSSPVATYLPVLNSVLAGILVVGSLVRGNGAILDADFLLSALPGCT